MVLALALHERLYGEVVLISNVKKAAIAVLIVAIVLIAAFALTVALYHPMNTVMSDGQKVSNGYIAYNKNSSVPTAYIHLCNWGVGNGHSNAYPFNFNGTSYGAMTIYLPAHINVKLTLTDYEVKPHTLKIELPYPSQWARGPIWAHTSVHVQKVINSTGVVLPIWYGNTAHSRSIWWNNTEPGKYWLVCGLTTHAEAGMYIYVIVSSSITKPYYTIK
ncbi:sulfocyanin [Picrophilus oshimae DSM 9789]|uniref:Sulfocyanin n=1 Tax=Picrophilus torridus (strain ATCC 700027 / DSM 9790 / JCM 10055 / NBRC 100828 / KAW 2/3) TaxID=1122961 RepID=A0A8G2FX42_PICTO|nr:sulfocyanin [Picrophilus oshimae DSM 9789]